MSQPRIVCVGHAALDRIYRVDDLPTGPTKMRALEHVVSGGGMAANAAATIARLGGQVELWSRVGDDDAGVRIRRGLEVEGVDIRHVERFESARSSTAAVIVDRAGRRMVIGNRDIDMPSDTSWLPLERLRDADVVLADLRWLEAVRAVFRHARSINVPTVLDADLGAREALPELLALTDYAIFSEPALESFEPELDLKARLDRVMLHGPRHAGVTLGEKGYFWRDPFGGGRRAAFDVSVVDTTGAGDAFHGAFAFGLAQKMAIGDCVRFASATAALKCCRLGARAGLPDRAKVDAFIEDQGDAPRTDANA
ncbi:MAG: PfkB family carbohydrate kinase [Pseudomonadota bacterium]